MILKLPNKIYISSANVDMQKSIDGLAAIVQCNFSLDPMSDSMYVFHNRYDELNRANSKSISKISRK